MNSRSTLPIRAPAPARPGIAQRFFAWQKRLSRSFDRMLPESWRRDGNRDFRESFAPRFLRPGQSVYDLGGGKHPLVDRDTKARLSIRLTGIDIDATELDRAPHQTYDSAICADVARYRGNQDADLVICQALLEHVRDVSGAFEAIASTLKPGGVAVIFVPSRNALFARLNLLLPQGLKKRILFGVSPSARGDQGFESFYDQCTPRDFERLANANDMVVEEERLYFLSSYFMAFFPAYLIWRLWLGLFRSVAGRQAAETFCVALRKR